MNIGRFFRRRDEDAELAREIEAHIAHEIDENVARGMSAEEARRRALIKFGSAAERAGRRVGMEHDRALVDDCGGICAM